MNQSFNPIPGQMVRVRNTVFGYENNVGRVAHVSKARGTLPTLIAVDLGPNRQVDFRPNEIEVIEQ